MTPINSKKIKSLVEAAGGVVAVAYEAEIGSSTLEKLMSGAYPSKPRKKLRDKICAYFKEPMEELFPFAVAGSRGGSRKSAS